MKNHFLVLKQLIKIGQSIYLGNCVDLIEQFDPDGEDNGEAAQWMVNTLSDNDNVIRIPKELFQKYVKDDPSLNRNDSEFYFVFDGRGHPNGKVNFLSYSDNENGDDIHYFYQVSSKDIDMDEIISFRGKLENGLGAGENMFD